MLQRHFPARDGAWQPGIADQASLVDADRDLDRHRDPVGSRRVLWVKPIDRPGHPDALLVEVRGLPAEPAAPLPGVGSSAESATLACTSPATGPSPRRWQFRFAVPEGSDARASPRHAANSDISAPLCSRAEPVRDLAASRIWSQVQPLLPTATRVASSAETTVERHAIEIGRDAPCHAPTKSAEWKHIATLPRRRSTGWSDPAWVEKLADSRSCPWSARGSSR